MRGRRGKVTVVTDEPQAEITAAAHDRSIVSSKEENLDAWLNPQDRTFAELDALIEDEAMGYHERRMAA